MCDFCNKCYLLFIFIKAICSFIKENRSGHSLTQIGERVFGSNSDKVEKFKKAVSHFNGSRSAAIVLNGNPDVPPEVLRTALERVQKGLMQPWILHVLRDGQIRLTSSFQV